MNEESTPKSHFIKSTIDSIKKWSLKEEPIKQSLSFEEIVKSFVVIIPIHAILYLWHYYSNFGTQYFLYFNPVDFISVFYHNNLTFLMTMLIIGVLVVYFLLVPDVIKALKNKSNVLLSIPFFVLFLIIFVQWLKIPNTNFYSFIAVGFFVFIIALKYKDTRIIYYSLVFFYLFYTIKLAKDNAIATKNSKPNFTIILNDNSFALKQDDKNHKDYFIGKVTDYVFVYSDSLKNVRAIPVSDIKEIRFPLGE